MMRLAPIGARSARWSALIAVVAVAATALSPVLVAQDRILSWSIDGGGTVAPASGAVWTLSGTIGQYDATAATALTGAPWQITGGFWSGLAPSGDFIYLDRFESQMTLRSDEAGESTSPREADRPTGD